jgi:hypothetical protein
MIRLRILMPVVCACVLLTACNAGLAQQAAVEGTLTMEALSVLVQSTLDASVVQPTLPPPPVVPTATPQPALPAESPTPTVTPAPVIPQATISQNTNCRSGPGTVYDLVYSALAGGSFTIIAGSTVPEYVVIEIPNKPGQTCWLWTRYASLSGDVNSLAKQPAPPTPTPSVGFSLEYSRINSCVGWGIEFKVVNTSSLTLKSYKVRVEDTDTGHTIDQSADHFDRHQGCTIDTAIAELGAGDKGYAYAYDFPYDPSGHTLKGKVTACTELGLGGECSSRSATFEP